MPVTIQVNGTVNTLVHKMSNGISIATIPDVCKTPTPGGPVPMPYPNIAQSITLSGGTTSVKGDKVMAAIKGSKFAMSNGDNAGVAGGVKSSTFMKEATWILYSFDVKMDGKNACRFTDKMFHNSENTVNLAGVMQQIAKDLGVSEQEARVICEAFCQAQKEHLDPKNTAVKGSGAPTRRFGELLGQKLKGSQLEQAFFTPRNPASAVSFLDGPGIQAVAQSLKGVPGFASIKVLATAGATMFPAGATVPLWARSAVGRVLNGLSGTAWRGSIGVPDLIINGTPRKAFDCKFSFFKGGVDELNNNQKRCLPRIDGEGKTRVIDENTCRCPEGKKQGWRASSK